MAGLRMRAYVMSPKRMNKQESADLPRCSTLSCLPKRKWRGIVSHIFLFAIGVRTVCVERPVRPTIEFICVTMVYPKFT